MKLKNLLGEHWLDAVDFKTGDDHNLTTSQELSNAIRFRLDGIAYTAIEDPDDGYRSSMDKLLVSKGADMTNVFNPVWVFGRLKETDRYHSADSEVIEFVDVWTTKVVLEVGTDGSDHYYPAFIANFQPENMVHNIDRTS